MIIIMMNSTIKAPILLYLFNEIINLDQKQHP